MNFSPAALAASVVLLAAVSLPGKVAPKGDAGAPDAVAPTDAAAAALVAAGWTDGGTVDLTRSGAFRARALYHPRCDGSLLLAPVAANGELRPLLAELAGPEGLLVYRQDGRTLASPPWLRIYLGRKVRDLARGLGLDGPSVAPVLAVVAMDACTRAALPWAPPAAPAARA